MLANNLSISSTDSSSTKDNELDVTKIEKDFIHPYQQQINRYLSHSTAIINDPKQRTTQPQFDERERRNTYTLPRPPRSNLSSSKDRRLTLSSNNCPIATNKQGSIHNETITTNNIIPTRDTDSSSTQDSGYSESTPFFLVQQATPDNERSPLYSLINTSKVGLQFSERLKLVIIEMKRMFQGYSLKRQEHF